MKTKLVTGVGLLFALLMLTSSALAMRSNNYWLDWFTPLTSSGGGPAGSANYAVNLTIGQTVVGSASSPSYQACLGYWCGAVGQWRVYLPLVLRESS
jgi:hypothetical protein